MHKNNFHNNKYDFDELTKSSEGLKSFVFENSHKTQTIDFANPEAVKALNSALLKHHYSINFWEFPKENLCPPIPGRADYIHHLADLIRESRFVDEIKILDIGTGATCIYPLLGNAAYNWKFVGTDVNNDSLNTAQNIIDKNDLNGRIELRLQMEEMHILNGIIKPSDCFAASMCNPPFFKSETEAMEATKSKLKGLGNRNETVIRNFSGTLRELSYKGGEKAFVHNYLYESSQFKDQCFWFTCLVSNVSHVKSMKSSLEKLKATDIQIIEMTQGNKISRIVAWTFLKPEEQRDWILKN